MAVIGKGNAFKGSKYLELAYNTTTSKTMLRTSNDYGVTWEPEVEMSKDFDTILYDSASSTYVVSGGGYSDISIDGISWTPIVGLDGASNVVLAYVDVANQVIAFNNHKFHTLKNLSGVWTWVANAYELPTRITIEDGTTNYIYPKDNGYISSMVFDKPYYDYTGQVAMLCVIVPDLNPTTTGYLIRYPFNLVSSEITSHIWFRIAGEMFDGVHPAVRRLSLVNSIYMYIGDEVGANRSTVYSMKYINGATATKTIYRDVGYVYSIDYDKISSRYYVAGSRGGLGGLLSYSDNIVSSTTLTDWGAINIGRAIPSPNYITDLSISNGKLGITLFNYDNGSSIINLYKNFRGAPPAPTASNITSNSITWNNSTGTNIVANGETKPAGSIWTGLTPGTSYSAYAYYPEDATYNRSNNGATANASTLKLAQLAPISPTASNITHNSIKWTSDNGTKIFSNGEIKDSGSVWTGLLSTTQYTAYAYIPESDTHSSSPNSSTISATTVADPNPVTPAAPTATVEQLINLKWMSDAATKITMSGLSLEVWENRPEAVAIDFTMARYNDNNIYLTECESCLSTVLATVPTKTLWINEFAIRPIMDSLNYVSRIKGYITVDTSGPYQIQITSDDYAELWLSSDDNQANKSKIAKCQNAVIYNGNDVETLYQNTPYMSVAIDLEKGKRYYIETRHIQGPGGNSLFVRWKGPNITSPTLIKDHNVLRIGDKNTGETWSNLAEEQYFYAYAFKPLTGGGTGPLSLAGVGRTGKVREEQVAPPAPIVSMITPTTMVWTSSTGAKIVSNSVTKDSGSSWTNLVPETTYTAYAYYPESSTAIRSADSITSSAKTSSSKKGTAVRSTRTLPVSKAPANPIASNVVIMSQDGAMQVGSAIYGLYTYTHPNGLAESGSTATWYVADSISGPWSVIGTPIDCMSNSPINYIITAGNNDKYLRIGIIPRTGTSPYAAINVGVEAYSDPTAEINALQVPPMASHVRIQKLDNGNYVDVDINHTVGVGDNLKIAFTYFDANNDPVGECIYRWYRSLTNNPDGDYELILGGDGNPYSDIVYITRDEDYGKTIEAEITPVSQ